MNLIKQNKLEPKNFDCLRDETRELLQELRESSPFLSQYVLVGGSALALYLCHRKSEDLDFFTFDDAYQRKEILEYCRRFEKLEILNETDDQLDLLIRGVKVSFFNARWPFLRPDLIADLNVADLSAIAAMKVNVMFLRAKYRDYYDLYCLSEQVFSLRTLFNCARKAVPGLTYKLFCIALTYIDDVEDDNIDHLEQRKKISKVEIRRFFEEKIRSGEG